MGTDGIEFLGRNSVDVERERADRASYGEQWQRDGSLRKLKEKHGVWYQTAYDGLADLVRRVTAGMPLLRVLEVGCGSGQSSYAFADRIAELDLLDIAPEAFELARSLLPSGLAERTRFQLGSAQALPYQDGSFDLVHSTGLLKHYPPHLALRMLCEQARVVSRTGFVLVAMPNRWSLPTMKARLLSAPSLRKLLAAVPGYRDPDDVGNTSSLIRGLMQAALPDRRLTRHFFGTPTFTATPAALVRMAGLVPAGPLAFVEAHVSWPESAAPLAQPS